MVRREIAHALRPQLTTLRFSPMRTIDAQPEPAAYTEWRAASQADINYGYDLIPGELRGQLKAALIAEQRGICAYTGIGINAAHSHIEHMIPQAHCVQGEGD